VTVGLVCALAVPLLFNLVVGPYVVADATRRTQGAIVGLAVHWTLAGALVALTSVVERRPLSTIGLRRLSLGEFGVAAGIGSALWIVFLVPLVIQAVGGPSGAADMGSELAAWVVAAGVVTAAVTEEVVFRGYALERLTERTGRQWIGALVSLTVFVAIHVPYWPLAHVVGVVVPAGVALTGLYLWKRNLPFVIVVHFVFNAPLVALALPG
jgi:membrane protease YdiL (CAAX protease family)